MSKSSKSHPTDSDVGVRKAASGVGRLRGFARNPSPPLALSAARPLFRHRNQAGDYHAGKEEVIDIEVQCHIKYCRLRRHHESALSFDAEKEGTDPASATKSPASYSSSPTGQNKIPNPAEIFRLKIWFIK